MNFVESQAKAAAEFGDAVAAQAPPVDTSIAFVTRDTGPEMAPAEAQAWASMKAQGKKRPTSASVSAASTSAPASASAADAASAAPAGKPKKKMSKARKQWLAQLMERKKRSAARKRGEVVDTPRQKRGSAEMSASECESESEGTPKYRRTSRSSKVDSASDTEGRGYSSARENRRPAKGRKRGSGRKGKGRSRGPTAKSGRNCVTDIDSSDLEAAGYSFNTESSASQSQDSEGSTGGEQGYGALVDQLAFLEDSQNMMHLAGIAPSATRGAGSSAYGAGVPIAGTLDDSLKFWEEETAAAEKDLSSFVAEFSAQVTSAAPAPAVVNSLFNHDLDEEVDAFWQGNFSRSDAQGVISAMDLDESFADGLDQSALNRFDHSMSIAGSVTESTAQVRSLLKSVERKNASN